jgi:hypothetical protein
MKRTYLDYDFPLIIIDDFYNQIELDLIWEELNFLCDIHIKWKIIQEMMEIDLKMVNESRKIAVLF